MERIPTIGVTGSSLLEADDEDEVRLRAPLSRNPDCSAVGRRSGWQSAPPDGDYSGQERFDAGRQHHDAHDAFGIDASLTARNPYLAGETAGKFREFGRGARVQAELIADGRGCLDHCVYVSPDFVERLPPLA